MYVYVIAFLCLMPWGQAAARDDQVIEKVMESVVGLYIEKYVVEEGQQGIASSVGSGVIVDSSGLVLTNAHVVDQAHTIVAQLDNGVKTFVQVIGVDAATDIALLQLEPRVKYQAIELGQSSNLKIGMPVTAIGNPFGLSQSVTAGIISGLHRSDHSPRIQDYIQLDAPINPGNSGGALVDEAGRLIGINSAIITSPGAIGNLGIGFAIPVEIALPIYQQLRTSGHTTPGFLGVVTQTINEALALAIYAPSTKGVMVSNIVPGSPAELAGLKPKDFITHVNDVPIYNSEHLRALVVSQGQDATMDIKVVTAGTSRLLQATTKRPNVNDADSKSFFSGIYVVEHNEMSLTGQRFMGLRITQIRRDSPVLLSGLMPGDIITSINNKKVSNLNDIKDIFSEKLASFMIEVEREGQKVYFALTA